MSTIALLPGDGIGGEILDGPVEYLRRLADDGAPITLTDPLPYGSTGWQQTGSVLPDVTVEADRPTQPPLPDVDGGRIAVVADQRVTLGTAATKTGVVLSGWRLVTADVTPRLRTGHRSPAPRRYEVLTDRWDLTAAEVVQVYLWRWQIELFLRWLKGQLHLTRLLGYSENAVETSVWLTVLVHLLLLLAARALGLPRRSPLLRARLAAALQHLDPTRDGHGPPTLAQLPLPGFDTPHTAPT